MVGIIGLGHMGASLAGALAPYARVCGFDPDPQALRHCARAWGVEPVGSYREVVSEASMIILAAPTPLVPAIRAELDHVASELGVQPVVSDIASVKAGLGLGATRTPSLRYVSLHPMAGREGGGATSGDPGIFLRANWALVLIGTEDPSALVAALEIPLLLGNGVIPVRLDDHDRAIAVISTLPHVSAIALAQAVARDDAYALLALLAAGSVRDGVRVAKTSPERIVEMIYPNRSQLAPAIDLLIQELLQCRDNLGDREWLLRWARSGNESAWALASPVGQPVMNHARFVDLLGELERLADLGRLVIDMRVQDDEIWIRSVVREASGGTSA